MALQLSIPNSLALPCQPELAQCVASAGSLLAEDGLPGLRRGEVLNVINGSPDGRLLYGVVCGVPGGPREGWLRCESVRFLEPSDAATVPDEACISLRELLQRVTIVCADEDWQVLDQPATLAVRAGDVLQLGTVKDNWAYGWTLENPRLRGWFPLGLAHWVQPSLPSLVRYKEEKLSPSATAALVELLKATPPPPPQQWGWEGDLPAVVVESTKHVEREFEDSFAQMEAAEAAARDAGREDANAAGGASADAGGLLDDYDLPEDAYPLVVCKVPFTATTGAGGALLELQVGDLVRVTSSLDAAMYYGFVEGSSAAGGWFPQRSVKLVYDPLSAQADSVPAQIGAPPLPVVPPNLLKRRGA